MFEKELCYLRVAGYSVLEPQHVMAFVLEDKVVHLNSATAQVFYHFS
jgi:hypothetical protein